MRLDEGVQKRRARRALAVVAALAALLACACFLGDVGGRKSAASGEGSFAGGGFAYAEALIESASSGSDVDLEGLGVREVRDAQEAPSWFVDEVLSLEGACGVMALDDWSVVGFSTEETADEALARRTQEMQGKGWFGYESGIEGVVTFTKGEGACTWAMLSCTQVGDETSVVVRVRRSA
ncbi:MAG: hypothetical protein Q4C41_06760 [Eggerthellaceae bacterium]|nr:hypothetical protein [Eggerthellaceae bacterium]